MNWPDAVMSELPRIEPANASTDADKKKAGSSKFTADGRLRAAFKPPRTRAREFAVQALYQFIVQTQAHGSESAKSIDLFTRDLAGFAKCDTAHYDAIFHGTVDRADAFDDKLAKFIDRPWPEISPIEHAVLWVGAYELECCLDVPWRVVINEAVELAKTFGGTDGHKWVNGVLNQLAPELRAAEVAADTANKKR
jgi:transcription antitermination protein NusB